MKCNTKKKIFEIKEQRIICFKVNDLGKRQLNCRKLTVNTFGYIAKVPSNRMTGSIRNQKRIVGLVNNKAKIHVTLNCFNCCYSIFVGCLYGYSYCEADVPMENRHISSCKAIPSTQHFCHICITLTIPIRCQVADERKLSAYMYQRRTVIYIIRQYYSSQKSISSNCS